jgi:hypothetical protein
VCPIGEARNPMLMAAIYIGQQAEISPLKGWPDEYSAGVVDALMAFRQARYEKQLRDQQEAADRR